MAFLTGTGATSTCYTYGVSTTTLSDGQFVKYINIDVSEKVARDITGIRLYSFKNYPDCRGKIRQVFVGEQSYLIGSDLITECQVSASYSPVADQLPVDTLTATLASDTYKYQTIVSDDFVSYCLSYNCVRPYIVEDGEVYQLGLYYTSDVETTTGDELSLTADSFMQKIADTTVEPGQYYRLSGVWYRNSRSVTYKGTFARNAMLWSVRDACGLSNSSDLYTSCGYTSSSSDLSINTSLYGHATSECARDLLQSSLIASGGTCFMQRDGKLRFRTIKNALGGTQTTVLDDTLDDGYLSKGKMIGDVTVSGSKNSDTVSMYGTTKSYLSTSTDFPFEYQSSTSSSVKYECDFGSNFLPCTITVSSQSGGTIMSHRFSTTPSAVFPAVSEVVDDDSYFTVTDEDVRVGYLGLTVDQSGGTLDLTGDSGYTIITIRGIELEQYGTEATWVTPCGGADDVSISLPDWGILTTKLAAWREQWYEYRYWRTDIELTTDQPIWIGEQVTYPILYGKAVPPDTPKSTTKTAAITEVNKTVCTGLNTASGLERADT